MKKKYNTNIMKNNKFRYKGASVNIFGLPSFKNTKNTKSIQKRIYLHSFTSAHNDDSPKNLLLMYDIPEEKKKERDWFRRQLKNFDFVMIQRSVWVGPSPLPQNFLGYLKNLGLQKRFKTFKLAKPYSS
ncbi:MAG: CRISPR-associated endonuclease Cas2 [Candidatus Paceibacterota bacterium]